MFRILFFSFFVTFVFGLQISNRNQILSGLDEINAEKFPLVMGLKSVIEDLPLGKLKDVIDLVDELITNVTTQQTSLVNVVAGYKSELDAKTSSLSAAVIEANDAETAKTTAIETANTKKTSKETAERLLEIAKVNYNNSVTNFKKEDLNGTIATLQSVRDSLWALFAAESKSPTAAPTAAPTAGETLKIIFRQTLPKFYSQDEITVNENDALNDNYAILDQMESFRGSDGTFHFKMKWPGDTVTYEWKQTSNPLTETIQGYQKIHEPYNGQYWGGLEPSSYALMDGSVGHNNWFYAVGSYHIWGGGIPAYAKTDDDHNYAKQSVELYAFF